MGRIRNIASLTKSLEYATARQTYYANTSRPVKTTVEKNPKDTVVYISSTYKVGTGNASLIIQASAASIEKFGGVDALNLKAGTDTSAATAIRVPRGFRPAKIHGMVGTDTPTAKASPVSGRRVIKYSTSSTGASRANFTAPIGNTGSTANAQQLAFRTIAEAVATEFNTAAGYGRVWFTPEYFSVSS